MSKKWRVIGSICLLGWLATRMDWPEVGEKFRHLDGRLWLAALFLYLLTQLASTWRWRLFARASGLDGSFRHYLSYYFVGMFFNLVLPTSVGGDAVRAWYLSRHPGPNTGRRMAAFLSVLADRVSGVAVLVGVACVAAAFCPVPLDPRIKAIVAAVGGAAVVGVVGLPLLERALRSQRLATPRLHRLRQVVGAGMDYAKHGWLMAGTAVLSLVVQVGNVIVMALVAAGLGLEVPWMYYGIVMPLVSLLTLLPISLNGMGIREWSTAKLLHPVGVGETEAVTLAFLVFLAQTAAGLTGVVPYLGGRLPRFNAREAAAESKEEEDPLSVEAA